MTKILGVATVTVVLAVVGILLVPVLMITALLGGAGQSGCLGEAVQANYRGPSVGSLSPTQMKHAAAVVARGQQLGIPSRGIVVALAVVSQESRFLMYANDGRGGDIAPDQRGVAASLQLPHDAIGSDHGSVGLFQQQYPWWGTLPELMDAATSAQKFYEALLKVPDWQRLPVTVAAQRVQRSAYPSAYADDQKLAEQLLTRIGGTSTPPSAAPVVASSSPSTVTEGPSAATLHGHVAGIPDSTTCQGAVPAAAVAVGSVVYPLPPGSGYRDLNNYGGSGSHWARYHTGDDLAVACGTPVRAVTAGRVIIRRDQAWAGPWLVEVQTAPGRLTTWYAHMRKVIVSDNAVVKAGQQIGEVGEEGNATGCHLHLEVHPHGGGYAQDDVDPHPWLTHNVGTKLGKAPSASPPAAAAGAM